MRYLRGFLPWIAFAIASSAGWQWAALAGLLLGIGLLIQSYRAGVPLNSQILELGTIVFFAVLVAFAFANPRSALERYDGALSMAWLALTAWGTLAIRRPFTTGIARRQAPREVWDSRAFRRINVVITAAWALAFSVTAAVLFGLATVHIGSTGTIPVEVVGFAIPALFTARYPQRVRDRFAAQQA